MTREDDDDRVNKQTWHKMRARFLRPRFGFIHEKALRRSERETINDHKIYCRREIVQYEISSNVDVCSSSQPTILRFTLNYVRAFYSTRGRDINASSFSNGKAQT